MSKVQKDRRRSKRHPLDLLLRFRMYLPSRPNEDPADFLPGRLHDISKYGISILTNSVEHKGMHIFHPNVLSGEQCLLEIEVPAGEENLVLRGKVVWYDKTAPGDVFSFRVGVEFLDPPSKLPKNFQGLLRHASSASGPP